MDSIHTLGGSQITTLGSHQIATLGGIQQIQCLTEEGVNFFLFRSDKPKALPMQNH